MKYYTAFVSPLHSTWLHAFNTIDEVKAWVKEWEGNMKYLYVESQGETNDWLKWRKWLAIHR